MNVSQFFKVEARWGSLNGRMLTRNIGQDYVIPATKVRINTSTRSEYSKRKLLFKSLVIDNGLELNVTMIISIAEEMR